MDIFPKPYPSQFDLRGESLSCYGSDFRSCVTYHFNDQGYRSDFNYSLQDTDPLLLCFGSSIATGHGLEIKDTFGKLVADNLNKKLWNLGQGCFRSSNQTILEQIDFFSRTSLNIEYTVIQFTHINRMGSKFDSYLETDKSLALENFCDILKNISAILSNKKWCWFLCDYSQIDYPQWVLNHPNKIIIDPDSVDFIETKGFEKLAPTAQSLRLLSMHPGIKWNKQIAKLIIDYFNGHQ